MNYTHTNLFEDRGFGDGIEALLPNLWQRQIPTPTLFTSTASFWFWGR